MQVATLYSDAFTLQKFLDFLLTIQYIRRTQKEETSESELSQIKKRQKEKNKFALAYPVLGFALFTGTAYGVSCIIGDNFGMMLYVAYYYFFFFVLLIVVVFTAEINKPKRRLAATVSVMGVALAYSIVFLSGFGGGNKILSRAPASYLPSGAVLSFKKNEVKLKSKGGLLKIRCRNASKIKLPKSY